MKENCVIAIAKALLIQVFWSALCSNQIPIAKSTWGTDSRSGDSRSGDSGSAAAHLGGLWVGRSPQGGL